MRNSVVLLLFSSALLFIPSLFAQSVEKPSLGGELTADWQWAVSKLQESRVRGWIGYSIAVDSPVPIWMGNFNLKIVDGEVEILGGRALESILSQTPFGEESTTRRVALLFRYDPAVRAITRARFQDLRLPYQRRRETLYWLGERTLQASLDHLLPLFDHLQSAESKRILVTAVGLHQSPRVLPFLRDLLSPKRPEGLRERAASALAFQNNQEAVTLARTTALQDSSRQVREESVEALEEMTLGEAESTLIELLQGAPPQDVRREAAEALGNKPSDRAVESLTRAANTQGEDMGVRLEAVEALGELPTIDTVPRLEEIFRQSSERRVKLEVIEALGERDSSQAREVLHRWLLEAGDLAVQMEALEALTETADSDRAKNILVQALEEHPEPRIRTEALEELADRLAGEAVQEVSRSAREDPHSQVRREAVEILGEIGDDASIDALAEIIASPDDPMLRRQAIEALAESGHPRAREILIRLARGNR